MIEELSTLGNMLCLCLLYSLDCLTDKHTLFSFTVNDETQCQVIEILALVVGNDNISLDE